MKADCHIQPYNHTDLTQGGSAVGRAVLRYRGLAQPKKIIHR
jgi:hypothetical protein